MNPKFIRVMIILVSFLILLIFTSASNNHGVVANKIAALNEVKPVSEMIGNQLWRLGNPNDADEEFSKENSALTHYTVSADSSQPQDLKSVPQGLRKSVNPSFQVQFPLSTVPEHGVVLKVRILDAHKAVPQMAVFTNQLLSGIVQIAGVGGTTSAYPFKKTYELYIPKEQLQVGDNELKFMATGCLYCTADEDKYLWWKWDFIELDALTEPAAEPIHGKYVESGTKVSNLSFYYDEGAVRHLPYVLKWLGIAYSGNIMRVDCATDVRQGCSAIKAYYETLRDYNTQAVALHLHTGNVKLQEDGSLPADAEKKLQDYVTAYGSMFQYYEIDNEPGLFNRSKGVNLAIANWLKGHIPELAPHLKTVAPGWAYAPKYAVRTCRNQDASGRLQCGEPDGWEGDSQQRLELEKVTDLTNGHAYGTSYSENKGGSLLENLQTFDGAEDGLPKLMLNTEYGTSDTHVDNQAYGAVQPKAAVFDRILRAHIGFADMFMQHAAFYPQYALFEPNIDLNGQNPAEMKIHKNLPDTDSRVSVMRRLNLAYATHGRPLTYEITNKTELSDKLVYFRGVDTSSLAPLPGSKGTSNKLLLNFVNFENSSQTVHVKVAMPEAGQYEGERFGNGDTYESARTYVSQLQASPELEFKETLAPGEAVQYILTRTEDVKPKAPSWVKAVSQPDHAIEVNWLESEGAQSYEVWRKERGAMKYQLVAKEVPDPHWTDMKTAVGQTYAYQIRVAGKKEASAEALVTVTDEAALNRSDWVITSSSGKPQSAIDSNPYSRWDTAKNQVPGQFIQVDMKESFTISRIELQTAGSPNDFPRNYEVFLSADGVNWTASIASGAGSTQTNITFEPHNARFVKIVQTSKAGNYWSIYDFQVYGKRRE
ncbi:discoidin domain-containing protein [Paenibacillus sp. HWE-109]|uniref:discoidin domain-containing protein n=1 Tax=Paenibacillus sp. HWE-109 TaxID=1306526 RepID=UPI001EDF6ED4|nr:discoidin domain-containing protein [Paenibacillus sp. HWE-109]UKS29222.1 discoidin domain-containing protein [Paenibacillus sp. HWE-109]